MIERQKEGEVMKRGQDKGHDSEQKEGRKRQKQSQGCLDRNRWKDRGMVRREQGRSSETIEKIVN